MNLFHNFRGQIPKPFPKPSDRHETREDVNCNRCPAITKQANDYREMTQLIFLFHCFCLVKVLKMWRMSVLGKKAPEIPLNALTIQPLVHSPNWPKTGFKLPLFGLPYPALFQEKGGITKRSGCNWF